jgi:Ion channel
MDIAPVSTAPVLSWVSLLTVIATALCVVACVTLQYETLAWLSTRLGRMHSPRRRRVLVLVLLLFALHVIEIWIFGAAYSLLLADPAYGVVHGAEHGNLLDYVYFAAVVFTTLGLGDLVPSGTIRFMVGTEALAGFTLISWSAAFTYLEMERFWKNN